MYSKFITVGAEQSPTLKLKTKLNMKTNIGKAISLLNTVSASHGTLDTLNQAITLLKREDEARQPLVPEKSTAMTPEQAINNFKLLLELSPRNSYDEYRFAVREIAETCIKVGIRAARS